ncbi:cardiolipin synthase [Vulcaniibacterium tengchongense]|uniref:Cardiolipin synthase n=1 Tax=Vulcaniibacterium tengchongense TaxID=1273429 RepID=A0A3N4VLJ4_9GAMM|nr:cardiolipin synthase [Vulcaniibacterium tengchongense]RPE80131.1 cardiolipin synthetase 2 [Vulcaniibacterium tengchongense]
MLDALRSAREAFASIPDLGFYLTLGWLGYLVGLGLWIVLQKREPVATLSWLISLAALPYLGFLIYYFFGPQRITRQRLRRTRARAALPPPPEGLDPSPDAIELARLAQATTGLPPSTATDVRLLVDGAAKYRALLEAIAQAREHVHLEYYIFLPDRTGTALRDALIERARAGVQVRLLLDAVGSGRTRERFLRPLRDAGAEVAWFHPMKLRWFWRRPWLNLRTHRKIVVIDGRIGFTGGINVTDDQDERLREDAFRDLHLRLEGDVVRELELVFLEDWAYATGEPPLRLHRPAPQPGPIAAQVLVSGPDSSWEAIHRLQVGAIHAARRRVWLVTPYFVPGEAARMALTSAALGGLDVRLLVPRRCDSRVVTYAARSYFDELLQAGVKIHEYGPRMLHSKALLCDDDLAILGSANFDHRSFRLNFEVSVLFRDAGVAAQLAQLIQHECSMAPRVRPDRAQPLWRSRLPEALARLVSPLL